MPTEDDPAHDGTSRRENYPADFGEQQHNELLR